MVMYPLETLKLAGIEEILIVSGPGHAGQFLELLSSGWDMGINIKYTIQEKPMGIAHALWVAKTFADNDDVAVILGDNIFEDNFSESIKSFKSGARIFLKEVDNPQEFGVAILKDNKIVRIVEKPKEPTSNYAVTGFYLYDSNVLEYLNNLQLSERNELEITDLNNMCLENGILDYKIVKGFWLDAGTVEGLYNASTFIRRIKLK